jgi:hypothetical protein
MPITFFELCHLLVDIQGRASENWLVRAANKKNDGAAMSDRCKYQFPLMFVAL